MQNIHYPVLLKQIAAFADILLVDNSYSELKIFDGTLGGGGYTEHFLQKGCQVFASDLDDLAISIAKIKFAEEIKQEQLILNQSNFADYIQRFENQTLNFIVLDLGFSSNQLEFSNRGFSYKKDEEILDLRFNKNIGQPVWKKIYEYPNPNKFYKIIYQYSGEKLSPKIGDSLFEYIRKQKGMPITVLEAKESIIKVIPLKEKKHLNQILSRVWQALRIWVNDEFLALELFLEKSLKKLKKNGLLAIVSFHSLEDKLVTNFFRSMAKPRVIDDYGNKQYYFSLLTSKAVEPDELEILENPPSRSAKLRILKKL